MIVSGQDNEIALGVKITFIPWIRPYRAQTYALTPSVPFRNGLDGG